MEKNLKQKALQNLAQTAGEVAEEAIKKESAKIIAVLQKETQYEKIVDDLVLLDTIAYRVYEQAFKAIRDFLERLKSLKLTYENILGFSSEQLSEYRNNFDLIVKSLEVLENIRYHKPSEILDIFFEYSCHEKENVAKQAIQGISKLAEYDLDIFYGDGKNWLGLGWEPQEKVLEKISSFDKNQKKNYFSAIIVSCTQILSPTITGTKSNYKTFTFRTGAMPAEDGVKQIRKKALDELQNLYLLAENIDQKKTVLCTMETATHTPHMGNYGDDVRAMIIEDTITVMRFIRDIVASGDMQIMQKIEHDTYWIFYHKGTLDETIRKIAFEIRDTLYENKEYQKFRILIGFESIFHDWEKSGPESEDFESEDKFREKEALKLAEAINEETYNEWEKRIISYASIESNDMATFPYFGKFLEHFGKTSPALALKLLLDTSDQLERFIIAIFCGVMETERKGDVYSLIEKWCDEGKYLFSVARFFEYSPELNEKLLNKILNKAIASNDLNTLNQIISIVSVQYNEKNKPLIKSIFMPALEKLTANKNSNWIFSVWFRKQRKDVIADMGNTELKAILDNLFCLKRIDYHAEDILCEIAKHVPELVIQFFCERLSKEKDKDDNGRYEAIPFNFHKLSEPLSQHPVQVVDAVRNIYDGNYGMFTFRGARLLKNIFPNFPIEFQNKLFEVVQSKEKNDLLFVMAILRNYDGNSIINNFIKEIVKILPDGSDLTVELILVLQSTGVVSGEYGFVNAFKQKLEDIQPWLQDESLNVKKFAQNYINSLEKRIEFEQKNADERVALRKHEYGSGED